MRPLRLGWSRFLMCVGLVSVLFVSACQSGQTGIGAVDDRPPAFRAQSFAVTSSTDDTSMDYETYAIDLRRDYDLPVVLIPVPPPSGANVEFTIRGSVSGFDRFFSIDAEADGLPPVRVAAPTEGECTAGSREVEIRGHRGCVGSTPRSTTAIIWTEGWEFGAEWSRTAGVDLDTEISAIIEWLNKWLGFGRR